MPASVLLLSALLASPVAAQASAPAAGPTLDLRLRHEAVDDDSFAEGAGATTLRLRAGWRIPLGGHWRALVELEHTTHLGGEDFNSSANGHTGFPTIADPDNTELNQAWVAWSPRAGTQLSIGRQRLNYDNQRFIGAVGWRQNEQTFDALDVQYRAGPWSLRYSYLDRVQRVFGDDNPSRALARWDLDAHLFNAARALGPGTLTGYAYLVDNQSLPASSQRTLGLRYALRRERVGAAGWFLNAELARQDDYAGGSALIDASYFLFEGGLLWRGHAIKAGWEHLGGDGRYGFSTPLATLHAFNGWADRFLVTPVDGLEDRYLGWSRKFGKFEATVVWHDYGSDAGARDFGREWNASLGWSPSAHWTLLAKAADFRAGDVGADLGKAWLSVEYRR